MKKKLLNSTLKLVCAALSLLIAAGCLPVCAYAKTPCISEITLASGTDGRSDLESRGYSVLFQSMNLVSEEGGLVFLGYKHGSDGITNLIVSKKKSDSIKYEGCTYKLVSGTSLNKGTDGTALYLYYTKDSAAGSTIVSLDTASGFSNVDEVISLRNDGSAPVRLNDGTLANLDNGVGKSAIYLLMYRSENIQRYISNVCIVTGASKAKAINQAASLGCDYYLDNNLGSSGKVSYIAYQRTADVSKAVSKFTITDSKVQLEKDEQASAHLLDVTNGKFFDETLALGDWAVVYASYDKAVSRSSKAYKKLLNSTEPCSNVLAGDPDIYAIYEGEFTAADAEETEADAEEEAAKEEEEAAKSDAETDAEKSGAEESTADGAAVDEFFDIDKTDEEPAAEDADGTDADADADSTATASVINAGSIVAISSLAIILILIVVGVRAYVRKRKEQKNAKK